MGALASSSARRLRSLAGGLGMLFLIACGDGDWKSTPSARDVLPSGGQAPERRETDLRAAASAAGCQLTASPADAGEHTSDPQEVVPYRTDPPTSGRHFLQPAADGAYEQGPADTAVVHALEHGRVAIWFDPRLPERQRATVMALFEEDSYQLLLVPRKGGRDAVAASAWNAMPRPNGTGRLIRCPRFDDRAVDALRGFRDEHRGRGPEPVP